MEKEGDMKRTAKTRVHGAAKRGRKAKTRGNATAKRVRARGGRKQTRKQTSPARQNIVKIARETGKVVGKVIGTVRKAIP
jgi:hypothetical protein